MLALSQEGFYRERLLFLHHFQGLCEQEKIVLFNVNVIDGLNSTVQKDMMVFISNRKIESIKNIGAKPEGYKEID